MLLHKDQNLYLIQLDKNKLTLFYTYGKVTFDIEETNGVLTIPIFNSKDKKDIN